MIDYEYQNLQVSSLQIYESLKWAYAHKLQFLDIGVSQLYEENKIQSGDIVVLAAFGAGFQWGSVILKW